MSSRLMTVLMAVVLMSCLGCEAMTREGIPVSSTAVEFKGVEREQVARILWEEGSSRPQGGLFGSNSVSVWPSAEAIDKPAGVIEYEIEHFLSKSRYRDSVGIVEPEPGRVIVWLKLESKGKSSFEIIGDLCFERNRTRERTILQKTAWKVLRSTPGATVAGVTGWEPVSLPIIRRHKDMKWIALNGVGADEIAKMLEEMGFERRDECAPGRFDLTRTLYSDPNSTGFGWFAGPTWRSREWVALQDISPDAQTGDSLLLLMGIAAQGERKDSGIWLFGGTSKVSSIGDSLADSTIKSVCLGIVTMPKRLAFDDPAQWMVSVEIGVWPDKTPTEKHIEDESRASKVMCANTFGSRFWQGVLVRGGRSVIVAKYYRYTGRTRPSGQGRSTFIPEFVTERVYPRTPWTVHYDPSILNDPEMERKLQAKGD